MQLSISDQPFSAICVNFRHHLLSFGVGILLIVLLHFKYCIVLLVGLPILLFTVLLPSAIFNKCFRDIASFLLKSITLATVLSL